jgi:predicted DCC family thiol-disulfide oxidoreductase YuxK
MTNGWTGGQFSMARAILGLALAGAVLPRAAHGDTVSILAALAALFVAAGAFDGWAALLLAAVWALRIDPWDWTHLAAASAIPLLLGAHAAQERSPFGSWDARGRVDPGGGWVFRPAVRHAVVLLWAMVQLRSCLEAPAHTSDDLTLLLACLPATFATVMLVRRRRAWPWLAALASEALLVATGGDHFRLDLVLLYVFAFDPVWVPRLASATETLFYDGSCGLCHRAVRFVLAEDREGTAVRFAPLGGETFEGRLAPEVRAGLPDSLVLLTDDGRVLVRSTAARHLMARLGGLWRLVAAAIGLVPVRLVDALYDGIARIRYRLFAKPKDACPILPPHLRERFSS